MTPTFTSRKKTEHTDKTFSFFLLTIEEYENLEGRDFEDEVSYFQEQSIEMEGYCSDISESDKTSMYYSMNLSSRDIKEVTSSECVVVTSIFN